MNNNINYNYRLNSMDQLLICHSMLGHIYDVSELLNEFEFNDLVINEAFGLTVLKEKFAMLDLLLANGANINHYGHRGYTPLMLVTQFGHRRERKQRMLNFLLERGATGHAPKVYGTHDESEKRLSWAVRSCNSKVVKETLENGVNPNTTVGIGFPVLFHAIGCRDFRVVKLLVKYGAEINTAVDSGEPLTPLDHAVISNKERPFSLNFFKWFTYFRVEWNRSKIYHWLRSQGALTSAEIIHQQGERRFVTIGDDEIFKELLAQPNFRDELDHQICTMKRSLLPTLRRSKKSNQKTET